MKHPNEVQLALLAGDDLGCWESWRTRRHVAHCADCQSELNGLRAASQFAAESVTELPKDLNWNRLAQEMTGNIRVGLAAGEAIASFDKPAAAGHPRLKLKWNVGMALACASAVFAVGFWVNLPQAQTDHLLQALKRIGTQGFANGMQRASLRQDGVVLEVSSSGIEVRENGRALSLMHPNTDGVTVSVNMRGSAGVRFIDSDTGQVTTNKVYYAEQ